MTMDKSCPGSRSIREPKPEYMNCPNCGNEVEIWTDELKSVCRKCGGKVFRTQQASCIDWCPHAKECVGPEVYERLMSSAAGELESGDNPLEVLRKEHERALEKINLLHAAGLCLKLGSTSGSAIWDKGIDHLSKVIEFIDKEIMLHFHREEAVLFPLMENHLNAEKSPTRLLLKEHAEIWKVYAQLKEALAELQQIRRPDEAVAGRVQDTGARFENLLKEHIKKENESLLPLAKGLVIGVELEQFTDKWKNTALELAEPVN